MRIQSFVLVQTIIFVFFILVRASRESESVQFGQLGRKFMIPGVLAERGLKSILSCICSCGVEWDQSCDGEHFEREQDQSTLTF